jgi:hypothetical protein
LTVAVTPSSLLSLRSIRFAHEAQVIPVIGSSRCSVGVWPGAAGHRYFTSCVKATV